MSLQTILGAGGVVANGLARELSAYPGRIRLVSRNPTPVNATDELFRADLTSAHMTDLAVAGSAVVYLVVGLPYRTKVWQAHWPAIMRNVIAACERHGAKLVFFDNVYMYGRVDGWMTEETPFKPVSKKGQVRAQIAQLLLEAMHAGQVTALIARSADLYGPHVTNSFTDALVFSKLRHAKKASWLLNDQVRHSLTLVADAVRATAVLGNTPTAYGQTWHLPTNRAALTGRQFIEQAARAHRVAPAYTVLSNWMVRLGGLFNETIAESRELLYQNEAEYLFDSRKFEDQFFAATPYPEGIRQSAAL